MNDKTVVVTGASNGIGLITALELAKQGARLLMVVRNKQKGMATVESIKQQTGQTPELFIADLSLVSQTRRVAAEISLAAPKIDVLVNNAGAMFTQRSETSEGLEMTFALNHMAYFVLTNALLDNLKAAPQARIVNVSSEAHRQGKINWDDLQAKQKYSAFGVYGTSKLHNILFSSQLARRLEGTGIVSNALHPGVVATGFAAENSGVIGFIFKLIRPLMITPEKGAATTIHLASSQEVQGITGKYWNNKRATQASGAALDQSAQQRLWLESERILAAL